MSQPYAKQKVLVQSSMREVHALTKKDYVVEEIDGKATVQEVRGYRHFRNHKAYMTAEEAHFLVNDEANKRLAEAEGSPRYWYPAGAPFPVPHDHDGERLAPPFTADTAGVTDPAVAEAAERQRALKEATLKNHKAKKKAEDAAGA